MVIPPSVIWTTAASEMSLILFLELSQARKAALVARGMVVVGSSYPNLLKNLQLTQICNQMQTY